jgi:hypothetical protein
VKADVTWSRVRCRQLTTETRLRDHNLGTGFGSHTGFYPIDACAGAILCLQVAPEPDAHRIGSRRGFHFTLDGDSRPTKKLAYWLIGPSSGAKLIGLAGGFFIGLLGLVDMGCSVEGLWRSSCLPTTEHGNREMEHLCSILSSPWTIYGSSNPTDKQRRG